jgi:uncharacterized membrane protein
MNKARLESFSDGVFAFAITLLVLGVQVPILRGGEDRELRLALIHSLSQLVPYVTSFATIGIIWLNHHELFHLVEKVDHAALTLNLLLLLIVSFIPYPTAVLSRFGPMPSSSFLYGLVLALLGLAYSLLAMHLHRSCLDTDLHGETGVYRRKWRNIAGTLTYPLGAILALWWPRVSVMIYFLLAVFYFLPNGRMPTKADRNGETKL